VRVREWAARAAKRGAIVALAAGALIAGTATAAAADEDGTWHTNEFAIWRGSNFSGNIYDTSLNGLSNYASKRFINTSVTLDNRANSSANGKSFRIYLFRGAFCEGESITHLALQEPTSGTVGHAYSDLGWFNDRASSHWNATVC
jgi:hypothetical protein